MSSLLQQAFGGGSNNKKIDLYQDVLKVERTCSLAQLRKAYYQQAKQYHPDKNPSPDAQIKFQAISWVYQYLKDPDKRADYDDTGSIPMDNAMDDNDDDDNDDDGKTHWKDYFDLIFGKLSTNDIDSFAMKYKMSTEEEQDVLKYYEQFKGNVHKMLEYVMLSEERDVERWMEDYLQPALQSNTISKSYESTLRRTAKQVQGKLKKQREQSNNKKTKKTSSTSTNNTAKKPNSKKQSHKSSKRQKIDHSDDEEDERHVEILDSNDKNDDDELTETEESSDSSPKHVHVDVDDDDDDDEDAKRQSQKKTKTTTRKPSKPAIGKKRKSSSSSSSTTPQDLIMAIRNKNRNSSNPFAALGARYGISMDEQQDDPLDDKTFEQIQSKLKKRKNGAK